MPTNSQRLVAIAASVAITVGGAWLASIVPVSAGNSPSVSKESEPLAVTVTGVRNSVGKVVVIVFDNRKDFKTYNYKKAVGYREIKASTGNVLATFNELKAGPYAIGVFHDENGNRDLDMKGQIPKEGYGTSGARDAFDEPTFKRASVRPGKVSVKLHYIGD